MQRVPVQVDIASLAGRFPGSDFLVIGNSYSLNETPPFQCDHSIGINRINRKPCTGGAPWVPFWTQIVDQNVFDQEQHRIASPGGLILYRAIARAHPETPCIFFGLSASHGHMWNGDEMILQANYQNSLFYAVGNALLMGARRIILAGCDMAYQPGKPTHHCGDCTKDGAKIPEKSMIRHWEALLKDMVEGIQRTGREIKTISPWKDTPVARHVPAW